MQHFRRISRAPLHPCRKLSLYYILPMRWLLLTLSLITVFGVPFMAVWQAGCPRDRPRRPRLLPLRPRASLTPPPPLRGHVFPWPAQVPIKGVSGTFSDPMHVGTPPARRKHHQPPSPAPASPLTGARIVVQETHPLLKGNTRLLAQYQWLCFMTIFLVVVINATLYEWRKPWRILFVAIFVMFGQIYLLFTCWPKISLAGCALTPSAKASTVLSSRVGFASSRSGASREARPRQTPRHRSHA